MKAHSLNPCKVCYANPLKFESFPVADTGRGYPQRALTGTCSCSYFVRMSEIRLPENTADYARWLAGQIEARGASRTVRLSPAAAIFVGMALEGYARLLDGRETSDMLFTVGIEDGPHSSLQTACRTADVAWAAYHLIVSAFPDRRIILRHSGRLLATHDPTGQAKEAKEGR